MAFALHGHKDGAQNRFNKYVLRVETVLVGWGGDQVSCYTTVGGDVLLKDKRLTS